MLESWPKCVARLPMHIRMMVRIPGNVCLIFSHAFHTRPPRAWQYPLARRPETAPTCLLLHFVQSVFQQAIYPLHVLSRIANTSERDPAQDDVSMAIRLAIKAVFTDAYMNESIPGLHVHMDFSKRISDMPGRYSAFPTEQNLTVVYFRCYL